MPTIRPPFRYKIVDLEARVLLDKVGLDFLVLITAKNVGKNLSTWFRDDTEITSVDFFEFDLRDLTGLDENHILFHATVEGQVVTCYFADLTPVEETEDAEA